MAEAALLPASDVRPPRIHVMGDLETWAKVSNKPVLIAIGAVKFDGEKIVDRIQIGIDPVSCQRYGCDIEADTVDWWMQPEQDAARAIIRELGKVDVWQALDAFSMWCEQTPLDARGSFWGNGAVFDNAKLQGVYRAVGLEWPFTYKQDACYRTLRTLNPDVEFTRVGTLHVPADDAEGQARHLQAICKARGIAL